MKKLEIISNSSFQILATKAKRHKVTNSHFVFLRVFVAPACRPAGSWQKKVWSLVQISLICLVSFFFSCKQEKQQTSDHKPVKKATGKLVTDNVAPPVVTPITPPKSLPVTVTTKPFSLDPRLGKEAVSGITPANGLPPSLFYNGCVQDKNGNFWFAIPESLVKYDGDKFSSYPLPAGNNVACYQLAISGNNELWAVINMGDPAGKENTRGVYIFNGLFFEPVPGIPPGRGNPQTNYGIHLMPQNDGTVWVCMADHLRMLEYKDRQLKRTITPEDFPFKLVRDVQKDKTGATWFTDQGDTSLTRFDGQNFKRITCADGLPPTSIFSAVPVTADSIYLSTLDGTYFYNGRQAVKINQNVIGSLRMDKQGTLWVDGRSGDVVITKYSSAGARAFGREDGLAVSDVRELALDRDDNAWIFAQNAVYGLYRPVTTYGEVFPATGIQGVIREYFHDRKGGYWFSSYLHGLSYFNGKTLTNYLFPVEAGRFLYRTENNIGAIAEDKAGNVWFGTAAGSLLKYDGRSFFFYDKSSGFDELSFSTQMIVDSKDHLWLTTTSRKGPEGITWFDGREKRNYRTAQGLCNDNVRCIFEDQAGVMWFGTANGLSRFRESRFTTFTEEDGLGSNSISAISGDEYGNLWLGTEAGISRFDGEQFTNYTTKDGLVEGTIRCIRTDSANHLVWLATDVGFTAIRIKGNHPDSVRFESYAESGGFPVKGSNRFMIDPGGGLLTSGGNNSLLRFDYKKVRENSRPFQLHISQVRINNETVCWGLLQKKDKDSLALRTEMLLRFGKGVPREEWEKMTRSHSGVRFDSIRPFDFIPDGLSLPFKANSVSFDFAAIDPLFSKGTRYQYKLEGFDKTWSPLNKNTNASFGNLREGSYTFRLKALNPYGTWSEINYAFRVRPPWHRTWWAYLSYILLLGGAIYAFIRWRTQKLQKEKAVLEDKVAARTTELKESLEHLKATQSQLIQSEKMASLGELTAGIAHEIQNPLNFVNNFSEVNAELIEELEQEATLGNLDEVKAIAKDLKDNEKKIIHHGKRADAIVKGMLQHSRSSSGQKEPTDINALCDEYLRLAYHGLRAKDKSFNATMKTDFDDSIGNISIIPQDIGRVILNLINNAFYAASLPSAGGFSDSEITKNPMVWLSTQKVDDKVLISVRDNGPGIPQKIIDKIFQPFFTTKPTGQGTGLGLSLSYDIVKTHGGEIKVVSQENEGTEFTIHLPII